MDEGLIYDVGMNTGSDTAYYLHLGFRVVAIEANPLLVEQVRERFATEIDAGRLVVLGVGIGPERGAATFWVNERHADRSTFSKEAGCRKGIPSHPIEVDCVPFEEILAEYGVPHYLKVDIEGHDKYCLSALRPDDLPRHLSVEAHSVDHLHQLRALGYRAFKAINQVDHNDPRSQTPQWHYPSVRFSRFLRRARRDVRQRVTRRPDRWRMGGRQRTGTWIFAPGSSGPFGEDTPGLWRSLEDVTAEMRAWYEQRDAPDTTAYRGALNPTGWYDFHATLDDRPSAVPEE